MGLRMTTATRQEVLGLYRRIFRLARKWQAASGQMEDTIKEKQYILNEARMLFQKNKNVSSLHWRLQGKQFHVFVHFFSVLKLGELNSHSGRVWAGRGWRRSLVSLPSHQETD